MAEKQITIVGLKKEQADLRKTFDSARTAFEKAQTAYEKAKAEIVEFANSYGRVLEVLEPPKPKPNKATEKA